MDEASQLDPRQRRILVEAIAAAGGLRLSRPDFEEEARQLFEDVPGLETVSSAVIDALVESLWAGYRAVAIRARLTSSR